jgi:hypothetical protein
MAAKAQKFHAGVFCMLGHPAAHRRTKLERRSLQRRKQHEKWCNISLQIGGNIDKGASKSIEITAVNDFQRKRISS